MKMVLQQDITIPAGSVFTKPLDAPTIEAGEGYIHRLDDNQAISLTCPIDEGSFDIENLFKPLQ